MTEYSQPDWIGPLSPSDIAAIIQGGCASGAYMPAVTYHTAALTMQEHGDDVFQYIQDNLGELPKPNDDESWSGLACFYLSYGVELFCHAHEDLADWNNEEDL